MDEQTLKKITDFIYLKTHIRMDTAKGAMVASRLRKHRIALGFEEFGPYLAAVMKSPEETQTFIDLLTTNETQFFRTDRVWEYFRGTFLPEWAASTPCLQIWSAASSTGEEAYTIAMCCEEHRPAYPTIRYQITATDISSRVLEAASAGLYQGRTIENFKAKGTGLVEKYFDTADEVEYQVKRKIKQNVTFGTHNLFDRPKKSKFYHIVFLRNVLIYFQKPDQEQVLSLIADSLVDDGILVLGESETLNSLEAPFEQVVPLVHKVIRNG